MNSKELRAKAWESLKGKYWMALVVSFVASILHSVGSGFSNLGQSLTEIVNAVDLAEMDAVAQTGAFVLLGAALVSAVIALVLGAFIGGPALVGCCNYFIKNTDSKPTFADGFTGYKVSYGRNVKTLFIMGIKLALWYFLFIIPGIIKTFEYAMIPYILAEDPTITTKDAFKKSKEMMTGNKWRLFKLGFSFIGWLLLCVLTFGVGAIFLTPYMEAATAEFYVELKNK